MSTQMLRREVRAARDVLSLNVCRVFDLVEADGRELLSMEYVDGLTLRKVIDNATVLRRDGSSSAQRLSPPCGGSPARKGSLHDAVGGLHRL